MMVKRRIETSSGFQDDVLALTSGVVGSDIVSDGDDGLMWTWSDCSECGKETALVSAICRGWVKDEKGRGGMESDCGVW